MRLTLHLLQEKKERVVALATGLVDVVENVSECKNCCNLTAYSDLCSICQKPGRDDSLICVVSCIQDLIAIESSASFFGLYHVLHGVLKPMGGIGPKDLRIDELSVRLVKSENLKELILATPATIEGEATALLIAGLVGTRPIKLSRIASGVPVGGDLQYADRLSLARSLLMRQKLA